MGLAQNVKESELSTHQDKSIPSEDDITGVLLWNRKLQERMEQYGKFSYGIYERQSWEDSQGGDYSLKYQDSGVFIQDAFIV